MIIIKQQPMEVNYFLKTILSKADKRGISSTVLPLILF